ncbi:MAG: RNA polymerase sigma factor [Thermoanaerobaculia bacterium]
MTFPFVIDDATSMPETREVDSARTLMTEEEFRAFYERTSRQLWSYLSRISGDRQKADDLLQEAYYRIYRAGAQYEDETHRRNSLFRIATNLVRDLARRERHYAEVPLESESDDTPSLTTVLESSAPVPERQAAIRTDLQRAMKKLEPAQRELLWLAYAQGASHEEIAEIVGVRAISVRTLLLRARRKLASMLTGVDQ